MSELIESAHSFHLHTYKSPAWCFHCKDFIWGLARQGYKCKVCGLNAHSKCFKKISIECGSQKKLDKGATAMKINGHEFTSFTYSSPTWCNDCNNFIWGFQKQGWKCQKCNANAHGRCVINYTEPCYVSQESDTDSEKGEDSVAREHRCISSVSSFKIEDGSLGGAPQQSFFIERDDDSSDSVGISSSLSSISLERKFTMFSNPEKDSWFASDFVGKMYDLCIIKNPDPFIVTTNVATDDSNQSVLQVILWLPIGKEQMILPFTDKEPPLSEVLEQSIPSFVAKKAQMLRVTAGTLLFSELEKHLIAAEASQLAPEITISVLGLEKGEKFGDDTIEKDTLPEGMETFLSTIATKVPLKGRREFSGSLDTQNNKNGTHSYFTKFCGNSIMFHVGPMIPSQDLLDRSRSTSSFLEALEAQNEPDFTAQLERDDFIKNNVVCVVFLNDSEAKFTPALSTKIIQTYFVVQPLKDSEGKFSYRLNTTSQNGTPKFGPRLPYPPCFSDLDQFKNFFLAKVVNANKASFNAPVFQTRRTHALSALLVHFEGSLSSMTTNAAHNQKSKLNLFS